jgi:hypothetical protein
MDQYRQRYREVSFKDIDVHSARHKVLSKLFYVPGVFYEYVSYLNLGAGNHLAVSVAMNTQKPATGDEMAAYGEVIESLKVDETAR